MMLKRRCKDAKATGWTQESTHLIDQTHLYAVSNRLGRHEIPFRHVCTLKIFNQLANDPLTIQNLTAERAWSRASRA